MSAGNWNVSRWVGIGNRWVGIGNRWVILESLLAIVNSLGPIADISVVRLSTS